MSNPQSLNHSHWECKYHIVFIPKYRRKVLFGKIRVQLRDIFRELAAHKECTILSGKVCIDHVHMLISIPQKYSVSQVVGYIKGKSAIAIARQFMGRVRNFSGYHFWARGYFVSTVGADEAIICQYIQNQEREDKKTDENRLF